MGRDVAVDDAQGAALVVDRVVRVIEPEREWLRGAFLWKWFVGEARGESFRMQSPAMRAVIAQCWGSR